MKMSHIAPPVKNSHGASLSNDNNGDGTLSSHIVTDASKDSQHLNTRGFMYSLGYSIGTFPVIIFVFVLAVTILSGAIFVIEVSFDHDLGYLWIPESTQAASSYHRVLPLLSTGLAQSRKVSVLVEPHLSSNLLTLPHFECIWELDKGINDIRAGISNVSLGDICLVREGTCINTSPLLFWSNYSFYNASVHNTEDLSSAVSAQNYSNGRSVNRDRLWGKGSYTVLDDQVISAQGFVLRYTFSSSVKTRFVREWEEELLKMLHSAAMPYDIIRTTPFIHTSYWDEFDKLIQSTTPLVAICFVLMFIFVLVAFSLMDYLNGQKNIQLESQKPIRKHIRVILSFGCVVSVVFSTIVGFGICTYFGKRTALEKDLAGTSLPFNTLLMVLPFLLMAIGVDDAFIITNAYNNTKKDVPIPERVGQALKTAGPAISYTTATDCIAFALGGFITTTPVIRIFCVYAAVCIFVDFAWQISLFLAILSLDEKCRMASAAACKQSQVDTRLNHQCMVSVQVEQMEKVKSTRYVTRCTSTITSPWGRFWVFIIMIISVLLGIWLSSYVVLKSPTTDLISSDSYVYHYLTRTNKLNLGESSFLQYGVFISSEPPPTDALGSFNTSILPARGSLGELNLFQLFGQSLLSPIVQRSTTDLLNDLASMKYGDGPVDNWISSFNAWSGLKPMFKDFITEDGYFEGTRSMEAAEAFQTALTLFLLEPEHSHYTNSLFMQAGNTTTNSNSTGTMYLETKTELVGTVLTVYLVDIGSMLDKITAIEKMYSLAEEALIEASCFHESFAKISFFSGIWSTTAVNAAICFAVVIFTSAIFLQNLSCILTVLICLTAIYIELLGLMGLAGVPLSQVTTIVLLSSFGLAVDSVAHITHAAHRNSIPSSTIKVDKAFKDVGGSVFLGGMTSFVGVCPLILAKAKFFNDFFVLFTFLVCCAILHGFIFTPALLSYFYSFAEKFKAFKNDIRGERSTFDLPMKRHSSPHKHHWGEAIVTISSDIVLPDSSREDGNRGWADCPFS